MLQYVIDIAKSLNPENINIVVGYKSKDVKTVFSHEKFKLDHSKRTIRYRGCS